MEHTKGELSTSYSKLVLAFTELYWKPNLDKFQLATILELFLVRTAAPDMYEALKAWDKLRVMQPLDSGADIDAILQECSKITDKALAKVERM